MEITLSDRQDQTVPLSGRTPDYESLFQKYWGGLTILVYRIVGDMEEAQDLALEAFIKLYRRPPATDSTTAASAAWAMPMAVPASGTLIDSGKTTRRSSG